MGNVQLAPVTHEPPASGAVAAFDMENLLPLSIVREHTKTDDIPTVTDTMLMLYRSTAFQAAEKYTGAQLTGTTTLVESVTLPNTASSRYRRTNTFPFMSSRAAGSSVAWLYGHKNRAPVQLSLVVGARRHMLPLIMYEFGLGCCNPCADIPTMSLLYTAGYGCEADVPDLIKLGVLKYIAHALENPGDVVSATNEAGGSTSGYSLSTGADPALASGAINIWRSAMGGAI